jgi:hypothetical protein
LAQQKAAYAQAQGDYAKEQGDTAQADHVRAESDHTRAESDHAAVEMYVDSLGAFDISAYHATGSVLAKYANLTDAIGIDGANIPDTLRKGGMSVKFVQSSDNKYVQYRLMADEWSTNVSDWQGVDDEPVAGSKNLAESGGVYGQIHRLDQEINGFPNYAEGYYLGADGVEITDYGYYTSDYIPIDATVQTSGITVIYGTYKSDARIVFYDASKNVLNAYGEVSGASQRTFSQSAITDAKYVRFSFENDEEGVKVKDQRTLLSLWEPTISGGVKGDITELETKVEDNSDDIEGLETEKDTMKSDIGALRADIDSESISFDVVLNTSIILGTYYIFCNVKQGKKYVLKATGTFTEIACYGVTGAGVTTSIGSFLTANSLTFTASQDFIKITFVINKDNITASGNGTLSISLEDNVDTRLDVLEQDKSDSQTVFYGEKRATSNFFDTVVSFHAKAGEKVSFIIVANASTFKSKTSGAETGINALTGIYLNGGETTYARLTSGVNGKINLWHTFIAPHDLDSLKIYCNKANDIVDGKSPLLSVEVRIGDYNLDIPDYYYEDSYLQNKIKRIGEVVQNIDGDAFAFTTDEHWEYNRRYTPAILSHLAKRSFFSKHVSTGDHCQVMALGTTASGGEDDNLNRYVKDFIEQYSKSSGKPFLSAMGNHEYLTQSYTAGRFDDVDLHNWARSSFLMDNSGIVYGSREKLYYYFDDSEKNLRYIFLSSFTPQQNVGRTQIKAVSDYDNEQLAWLTDIALNVQTGWKVIVVTHIIFELNTTDPSNVYPYFTDKHKQFLAALLAENGDNKIVAVLTGHTHRDGLFLVKDSDVDANTGNSLFVVTTTCDANGFDWDSERVTQYRPTGTISEVAFDVVCFDRNKEFLDFVRIGAPANNAYQHTGTYEERIIRYVTETLSVNSTITLDSILSGTKTWASNDTSVATISDGVVSGVASGHCMVTVENEHNQVELFKIKVSQ